MRLCVLKKIKIFVFAKQKTVIDRLYLSRFIFPFFCKPYIVYLKFLAVKVIKNACIGFKIEFQLIAVKRLILNAVGCLFCLCRYFVSPTSGCPIDAMCALI